MERVCYRKAILCSSPNRIRAIRHFHQFNKLPKVATQVAEVVQASSIEALNDMDGMPIEGTLGPVFYDVNPKDEIASQEQIRAWYEKFDELLNISTYR